MRSIDGPKSDGQRLFEAFKQIKKRGMGVRPFSNLRPSEIMMMHSILHCLKKREAASKVPAETGGTPEGVTISELGEFTRMTSSAVSQTVKALEEKGYAVRAFSPADRRVVLVSVSDRGLEILRKAEKHFLDYLDAVTEALGKDDTDRLIGLLEKLAGLLPEKQKTDGKD